MTAFLKFPKILICLLLVLFSVVTSDAQKFVFVDVNRIMESIEDYQLAQEELDRTAAKWRQEIAQEYDKIKGMYNRYQAEQVLLSDEARKQREDEIMSEEKIVRDRQKDYFGPEGALFERRQTLVKPIQDRVYAAIEEYANERGYDFVFDLSSNMGLIFSNPEYDKTEDLLRKLR